MKLLLSLFCLLTSNHRTKEEKAVNNRSHKKNGNKNLLAHFEQMVNVFFQTRITLEIMSQEDENERKGKNSRGKHEMTKLFLDVFDGSI